MSVFLITVVKELLLVPGLREDLTFVFGVFSPQSLLQADENDLLTGICNRTDLVVELN